MGFVKMLGVLIVISAIVLRAECALTVGGVANAMFYENTGAFTPQTASVTETGLTGAVKFSIMSQAPLTNPMKFMINADTGVLAAMTAATFNDPTAYTLVIKAMEENASPANEGMKSIVITVADLKPVFTPVDKTKEFMGDQAAGTTLITLMATDPDPDTAKDTIAYSCMKKTDNAFVPSTKLTVGVTDGTIKVKTGETLEFGDDKMYEFMCYATFTTIPTTKMSTMVTFKSGAAVVYSSVIVMLFALMLTYFF